MKRPSWITPTNIGRARTTMGIIIVIMKIVQAQNVQYDDSIERNLLNKMNPYRAIQWSCPSLSKS